MEGFYIEYVYLSSSVIAEIKSSYLENSECRNEIKIPLKECGPDFNPEFSNLAK